MTVVMVKSQRRNGASTEQSVPEFCDTADYNVERPLSTKLTAQVQGRI